MLIITDKNNVIVQVYIAKNEEPVPFIYNIYEDFSLDKIPDIGDTYIPDQNTHYIT